MQELYLGLISGTSMDAVDAALVDLADPTRPRLIATHASAFEPTLREALVKMISAPERISLADLGQLDRRVGEAFADTAKALLAGSNTTPDRIRAIGSHGQNIYHAPDAPAPFSLQIGDPNIIAEHTGITTVADFRRRDMAAGGQGAPLAPALHSALFREAEETRCVVNLGGIANITHLPCAPRKPVTGFDTGPANALMDGWAQRHLGEPMDYNGAWARNAAVDEPLLKLLLDDVYFRKHPPKSTGREYFNLQWLQQRLAALPSTPSPASVQRTLCELTARSVAEAIAGLTPAAGRILLCGGGAHNDLLKELLQSLLQPVPVELTTAYGLDVDHVESCAFAWLAMRTLRGRSGNLPEVTGAHRETVLGGIYQKNKG